MDVELSLDPPLRTDIGGTSGPAVLPNTKGFTMPAESESREYLGTWKGLNERGGGLLVYKVTLSYKSPKGKKYKEEMRISFEHVRGRAYIDRPSTEESLARIAEATAKIAAKNL